MEARYLKITDAAKYLSVTRNTLNKMVSEGLIPPPKRLSPRLILFDRHEIDRALNDEFMREARESAETDKDDASGCGEAVPDEPAMEASRPPLEEDI